MIMGKRKNRQSDVNDDANMQSSESGEDVHSGTSKCPHIAKAINFASLRKILKKNGIKTACATCCKSGPKDTEADDETGVITSMQPLWLCLRCGNQACGRTLNQHAEQHYKVPHSESHCLAIDTQQWSIWCYDCENVVSSDSRKTLLEAVEFIKKLATTSYTPPQPSNPSPVESPTNNTPVAKDKQKVLTNLTKVGGLMNLGNTCFFNSVLQCLAQTPFLIKVLEDLREPGAKFVLPGGKFKAYDDVDEVELAPIEGVLEGWGSFTATLWKTLTDMQSSDNNQTYRPIELLNSFKKKTSQCMDGGQHDAHELLRHLLELVRNDDVRRYQAVILKKIGLDDKAKRQAIDKILKAQVKFYGNQLNAKCLGPEPVFRGVLVSTLECLECHHSSQRTEPFLDLSLPVLMDKPQPPIVKRRSSGMDDNVDSISNNTVSNVPSKHQLKKDKKAARKNRKNRKIQQNSNINESLPNDHQISEEHQASQGESEESDADVEDNIEVDGTQNDLIIESGYSSEKVSTVASPVSPGESTNIVLPNEPANQPGPMQLETKLNSLQLHNQAMIQEVPSSLLNSTTASMSPANIIERINPPEQINRDHRFVDDHPSSPVVVASLPGLCPISPKESPHETLLWNNAPGNNNNDVNFKEVVSIDNGNKPKITFSEAETDECHSPAEVDDVLGKNTNTIIKTAETNNGLNSDNASSTGLIKLSVTNSTHQSPTRYQITDGDCSIQSCLNQFTALELMSGSNKVGCEACTARENKGKEGKMVCTPSTKQYLVSRVPAVLILHLKRFQSQRFGFRKVNKHVAFPLVLDLAPVCKEHDKPKIYALYGIVEHSGTLHGGHYVAYVKSRQPVHPNDPRWAFLQKPGADDTSENSTEFNSLPVIHQVPTPNNIEPPPGRWYYVSDSRVVEIDEASVLKREAYLLFYERIL